MGDQWHVGPKIGTGAFGEIYRVTHRDTGVLLCKKVVRWGVTALGVKLADVKHEVAIMETFKVKVAGV